MYKTLQILVICEIIGIFPLQSRIDEFKYFCIMNLYNIIFKLRFRFILVLLSHLRDELDQILQTNKKDAAEVF